MLLVIITSNKSALLLNYSLTLNAILYTPCQHRIVPHFASSSCRFPSSREYMSVIYLLQCCVVASLPRGKRI